MSDVEVGKFWWEDEWGHLARGTAFPGDDENNGIVVVVWDRESWPEEERLDNPHPSIYGSVGDLLQAAGGELTWGEWP